MTHSDGNMDLLGRTTAFYNGKAAGVEEERERILQIVSWLFPSRPNEPIDRLIELIKEGQK